MPPHIPPLWRFIPDELLPNDRDQLKLLDALDEIIEAIKIRHDFETAVSVAARERRLTVPSLESDFATTRRPLPSASALASQYASLKHKVAVVFLQLENKELMRFLLQMYSLILPDIGSAAKPVRFLGRPGHGILNTLLPDRLDILILLLKKHPLLNPQGSYW
jgi:hypothetical protein